MTVTGAEGYYNATLDYGDGCTTVTDGKGIHCYYYDPDGNILREAAPDGSTTTYEWDEFHHLLARHSPAGRVEKFEYNAAHGQLSRYTAADGAEWLYRYDERGLLSNITDPAGQTWTQLCDERGLPVSLVSPQGEETRLAYTAQGLLSGIFRQDERRLGIEYDHHNRPETLTDVMGREHHTEYSGHDLPVKMRGPGGQSVRLQWQQHHKLSGLERAETGAEGFRYDRHGNLLAYTDGIPVEVKSVTTVEELLAQQKACDAAPTLRCRSEVGQNALRLAQLPVARAQLNDATFAASPEGKTLRTDLLQRAIYLKQWSQADTLYNEARQQNTLSAAERRQWFDVLLAGQLDDRILALQSQGIFTDPQSYITYATALAYRGEKARLQHYLIENKPLFTTDAQEKSWLYLLSKYSANPVQALANYTVQFADNRQYVVGATLPVLLKEGQYDAAQKLLATLPANEMLEERYAVSVATRNKAESLRLARLLYQQEPANLTRLDQLTWQLMQNEQSREAADLLLQRYPFQGDARVSQTLMARLASLLESHPYLATPAKVAILSKPLPLAAQRQWQSQLPGIADNCPAIVRLLGDMSPSYDAAAWNRLAKCYRDTLPGVALYAWLQAEQRQPNAWQHRAVAYQAYQVEDYATALAAWQKISLHDMSNEDLLAAANTAQAAGNGAARDRWLQQAEQRGLGNNALYWWLHAQRYIPGQPELALSDLTRSINIAPSANAYVARATIYRQRHNVPAAVSDLRAALELEPNNSNIQAALGYALWDSGDIAQSREMLEQAHKGLPDDPALIRQLAYVNQRLDDMPATQHYARLVIDDIDNQALINPLTPEQNQQRFNFRRLHEEVGRRWTFSFDSSIGLRSGAMSTANNNVGGAAPGKSYRSYGQLEAEYRIGRNMLLEGDLLSVYSRVFADTGENGVMMPVKNPMSGTGLRWKPLRDQIFFLAVEQQLPLNGQNGASDTMLRASASFFNGGKYSDEWHPNGSGWFAQNLYLDAAQYIRQDIQAWTADYRVSWHQKVANGQTIEPYAHVQDNGYRDKGTQGAQLGGVGVRWNIWTGETHYDAWPHKVSLGVEYQHTFKAINQRNGERNNAFLTIGVHW